MQTSISFKVLKDPVVRTAVVGFVSFGVGTGIGYLIGRKKKEPLPEVEEQVWTMADLKAVRDENSSGSASDVGREFIESLISQDFPDEPVIDETDEDLTESDRIPEAIRQSIFNEGEDVWDYEVEMPKRTSVEPYILHKDEFHADERNYSQNTLMYYAGDNVTCDEKDTPIYNIETIIGPMNFGHGSGDQNVFYVRNDKLKSEFEVIRDQGHYTIEVLGLEAEAEADRANLQHSAARRFKQE